MVKPIKGQQEMYSITPEEKLSRIVQKSEAHNRAVRDELTKRSLYDAAHKLAKQTGLDLAAEVGTPGKQEVLKELRAEEETSGRVVKTTADFIEKRRAETEFKVLRALAAVPMISNMDLAEMTGVDEHGLAGVLSKCDKVERVYDGNLNNERMMWRLKK